MLAIDSNLHLPLLSLLKTFSELFGMLNTYRNDIDLFVQRIEAAVKAAAGHPKVDADKVGIIGYCFGEPFYACILMLLYYFNLHANSL